jgi:WD40 repeat protein
VEVVAFSPDGRLIVSAGQDGLALVWEVATGKNVAIFTLFLFPEPDRNFKVKEVYFVV